MVQQIALQGPSNVGYYPRGVFHVLTVSMWASSRFSGFLQPSKAGCRFGTLNCFKVGPVSVQLTGVPFKM